MGVQKGMLSSGCGHNTSTTSHQLWLFAWRPCACSTFLREFQELSVAKLDTESNITPN